MLKVITCGQTAPADRQLAHTLSVYINNTILQYIYIFHVALQICIYISLY